MKLDKQLSSIFNTEPSLGNESLPTVPAQGIECDNDFDLARSTLRDLIVTNKDVITDLVNLARNSEHPRAYEVAGQLIKAQSEIAKDLLGLHKQKKDITGEDITPIKTQNNIVFAGSTSELMKIISSKRGNVIDG